MICPFVCLSVFVSVCVHYLSPSVCFYVCVSNFLSVVAVSCLSTLGLNVLCVCVCVVEIVFICEHQCVALWWLVCVSVF